MKNKTKMMTSVTADCFLAIFSQWKSLINYLDVQNGLEVALVSYIIYVYGLYLTW